MRLAKHVASLDYRSGGRFIFGIGGGWNAEEMANHGTAFKTRFTLMRERIEAMKAIWTSDVAEYHGEHVNFDPMWAWPKPVQKPHPPIIVGGEFPHGAKRAIAYGNGWMPIGGRGLDALDILPRFRQLAAEAGRNPDDVPMSVFAAPQQAPPDVPLRLAPPAAPVGSGTMMHSAAADGAAAGGITAPNTISMIFY